MIVIKCSKIIRNRYGEEEKCGGIYEYVSYVELKTKRKAMLICSNCGNIKIIDQPKEAK